jgi:hypothetical protein
MLRFYCILSLALTSCHTDKPTASFKKILNSSNNNIISKLNFEGAYSDDNYSLGRPVYFFRNGLIFYDGISGSNISEYEEWLQKYLVQKTTWGTYEIKGDTIKASIYYNFATPIVNDRIANFEGIIKNTDTILQWHLVEPYPKLRKYPREVFGFLFK